MKVAIKIRKAIGLAFFAIVAMYYAFKISSDIANEAIKREKEITGKDPRPFIIRYQKYIWLIIIFLLVALLIGNFSHNEVAVALQNPNITAVMQ